MNSVSLQPILATPKRWLETVVLTDPARIAVERTAMNRHYALLDRMAGMVRSAASAGFEVFTSSPVVLLIDDLVDIVRCSRSTIERRRRAGTFPIPELPSLDSRPRWSHQTVEQYLASTTEGLRPRRGRPRLRRVN